MNGRAIPGSKQCIYLDIPDESESTNTDMAAMNKASDFLWECENTSVNAQTQESKPHIKR